ncbi:MAG: CpsD/CapB family tyrosine-protein kinase [Steroidobacteraceae bacterium]
MNQEAMKNASELDANSFVEDLISQLQFSEQTVSDIRQNMQDTGASFIEAALSLQLLTNEQVNEIMSNAARLRAGNMSIIEAARRKFLNRRNIIETREPEGICTPNNSLTIAHDPYSERSEKLRGLRTELTLRLNNGNEAAMMAIVSPGHGEGRTQLAAELAIAFAQLERRTLLVDADLRSPGLHKLFGCDNEIGLSQAISEGTLPYLHGVAGLKLMHFLAAGPVPSNPIEMLSTKRFEQLVSTWRQQYDIVIFDTPPVAAFADALTVSTLVKRVLLTTRTHHSKIGDAKEMLRRLSITHSEILGAVLNNF